VFSFVKNSHTIFFNLIFKQALNNKKNITKEKPQIIEENFAKLYPNPNSGQFEIITNYKGNLNIEVYDIYGKIILKYNTYESFFTIDCSHLPNGMYLVRLYGLSFSENLKFIKQ